ncbi:hypothetical protein YPPY36_5052, partial [Yersinia pestis PY-36]
MILLALAQRLVG